MAPPLVVTLNLNSSARQLPTFQAHFIKCYHTTYTIIYYVNILVVEHVCRVKSNVCCRSVRGSNATATLWQRTTCAKGPFTNHVQVLVHWCSIGVSFRCVKRACQPGSQLSCFYNLVERSLVVNLTDGGPGYLDIKI